MLRSALVSALGSCQTSSRSPPVLHAGTAPRSLVIAVVVTLAQRRCLVSYPLPSSPPPLTMSAQDNVIRIGTHLWTKYLEQTPKKLQVHSSRHHSIPLSPVSSSSLSPSSPLCCCQLLDHFLVFAVVNGALLALYLILNGSFPFNSFLAAFIAAVAFFVFTVCLRVQISRPADFGGISAERAYAEYVCCNVILFFAVITFIG